MDGKKESLALVLAAAHAGGCASGEAHEHMSNTLLESGHAPLIEEFLDAPEGSGSEPGMP